MLWAHLRGIQNEINGKYLKEKALIIMVISFFQQNGLLPVINDLERAERIKASVKMLKSEKNDNLEKVDRESLREFGLDEYLIKVKLI